MSLNQVSSAMSFGLGWQAAKIVSGVLNASWGSHVKWSLGRGFHHRVGSALKMGKERAHENQASVDGPGAQLLRDILKVGRSGI